MKTDKRGWIRVLLLAAGLLQIVSLALSMQEFLQVPWEQIISPEKLPQIRVEYIFRWCCSGTLMVVFLFQAAVWNLPRPGKTIYRLEGSVLVLLALLWCGTYFAAEPRSGWSLAWIGMAVLAAAGAAYDFWKLKKLT